MARFQILSLIGGGIRGAFVTSYLYELEKKLGRPIAECFDLIAGTSTGGIIAAGLAAGLSAADMHDFYVRYGAKIFSPRPPYRANGIYRWLFPLANWAFKKKTGNRLDAAFRARFCPDALQESFEEGFGDRTMKDVKFTRLIIPSVNLTKGEPYIFRSNHLPKGVHDQDVKISDVLIATTAAPTYFPHRQIGDCSYVDGGMYASDPSMLAIAEAMRIQQLENSRDDTSEFDTGKIHLLSIGTGRAQYSLSPPGGDAGMLYWASRVAEVLMTSQVQGIHLPMKFFLNKRYHHVNFEMTDRWGLDAVEYIPNLFQVGRDKAEETYEKIHERFFSHQRKPFKQYTSTDHEILLDEI